MVLRPRLAIAGRAVLGHSPRPPSSPRSGGRAEFRDQGPCPAVQPHRKRASLHEPPSGLVVGTRPRLHPRIAGTGERRPVAASERQEDVGRPRSRLGAGPLLQARTAARVARHVLYDGAYRVPPLNQTAPHDSLISTERREMPYGRLPEQKRDRALQPHLLREEEQGGQAPHPGSALPGRTPGRRALRDAARRHVPPAQTAPAPWPKEIEAPPPGVVLPFPQTSGRYSSSVSRSSPSSSSARRTTRRASPSE